MRAPRLFSRLKGLAHPRSYVVTRLTRFEGGSFFPFLVAYLVSYRAFRVKILTSVVKKKKNLIIQMYPCPNVLRNKCAGTTCLKFESAKNQVKRAQILVSIVFGDGMFVIIEISIVLRVFQRIVEYRKLERIIRFGNN